MSRQLPSRPNLEYLKKEAKDLLRRMREKDPSAQLADAQHRLAAEYGFASWPKLKAHVEPLVTPLAGRWTANLASSIRHPANPFQAPTIQFDIDGDRVVVTDVVVDESGREEQRRTTIHADGRDHAVGDHGYTLCATWRNPFVLEFVAKQHGQPAGGGTYEVSRDGMTLTISNEPMVIVLDRVQSA